MRLVFVGFSCSNSCIFCAQGDWRSRRPDPGDQLVREAVAQALKDPSGDRALAFAGGEPAAHPLLPDWIGHAKSLGASRILLQTNGRALRQAALAKRLVQAGLDRVEVSLQGSSAAMHDYHTGVPGSWLETLAGVRQAKGAGLGAALTTVITRSNFRHLSEIVSLAAGLGADAVRLQEVLPFGRARDCRDRVVPESELARPYLEAALERARALRLGFVSDESACPASAAQLFAGLGEKEEAPAPGPKAERLLPKSKAKPGLREVRGKAKQSGDSLRPLFPEIFHG